MFFLILSLLMHLTLLVVVSSFASLSKRFETMEVFMLNPEDNERASNPTENLTKPARTFTSRKLKLSDEKIKVTETTKETELNTTQKEGVQGNDDFQGANTTSSGSQNLKVGQGAESTGNKAPIDTEFGSVTGPKFIYYEKPNYPPMARRLGKEGKVLLRLTIDEKGELIKIEVLESAPYGFTEAAIEALKKSKFAPAKKDGKPVPSRALLPVKFILTN